MRAARTAELLDRYRVTDGSGFKLRRHDPADRGGGHVDHHRMDTLLAESVARLSDLQNRLYADGRWSLLMVLQAMDAAGKDGTIKHVMTGVNPQGVQVTAFKQPGPTELAHGFLWRVQTHAPARGQIAIFNRSHYEDVLVCRVHPELVEHQHLPDAVRGKKFWRHRLDDIANYETYLSRQGTRLVKIFLHLSRDEQKRRFLARIDHPDKNWKFSSADLAERAFWDDYESAYETAIGATAAPHAPWFVVPADDKAFAHLIVAEALIEALEACELKSPPVPAEEEARLEQAAAKLRSE